MLSITVRLFFMWGNITQLGAKGSDIGLLLLKAGINAVANKLIAAGVIDIKLGLISFMSIAAQAKWQSQLSILNQVQATGGTLTAEQAAAYDSALQGLVSSSGTTANA